MSDTVLLLAALITLNIADWRQTLDISRHDDIWETNCLLGENPSDGEINAYFLGYTAFQIGTGLLIDKYAGKEWRNAWWAGYIGLQLGYVTHNHKIGLRVRF